MKKSQLSKIKYSILDLVPTRSNDNFPDTFLKTGTLAKLAEDLGFTRYWLSEHHNAANVISSSTAVLISYVASKTQHIRVGSGGIMLPNHSTLSVAENFGTLDALYPNRIDLGLGRATGTDQFTAEVLRRGFNISNYDFEKHISEVKKYLSTDNQNAQIRSFPGEGANVSFYMLGSSPDSAFLAARLGLPYAFAGHFAPGYFFEAADIYKTNFQPSATLEKPYLMLSANIIAADTDDEAQNLALTMYQSLLHSITNKRQPILKPENTNLKAASQAELADLNQKTLFSFIGSPATIQKKLIEFTEKQELDEFLIVSNIYDFEAKKKSLHLISEIFKETII